MKEALPVYEVKELSMEEALLVLAAEKEQAQYEYQHIQKKQDYFAHQSPRYAAA